MGNCFSNRTKPNKIQCNKSTTATTPIHLSGDPTSPTTLFIHFASLFKTHSLLFTPLLHSPSPTLHISSASSSGDRHLLLRFLDLHLPQPPLSLPQPLLWVATFVELQHKSATWHLGRVVRWGQDLATRGGKKMDPAVGTPKMEMNKFGKSYGMLVELLVEHARMEERVVFPLLKRADPGLCKVANEEHARDLPIINGIKEDIKSIGVLDAASSNYKEALSNLSSRLKSLQEHCKEHFEEEERNVLPLIEALELSKEQEMRVLEQCFDSMPSSHSHLFKFMIQGLQPQDAMQYLDLIIRCKDEECAASMIRTLMD